MSASSGETLERATSSGRWGLRLGAGVVATLGVAYFAAREFDAHSAWRALTQANLLYLGLSVGAMLLNIALKVWRWQWLFRPRSRNLGWGRLLRALIIGQLGNAMLPARLGDASRLAVTGAADQGATGMSLMTIVVEKAIDSFMLLAVLLALLPFVALAPQLSTGKLVLSVVLVLLLAVLTLLAAQSSIRHWLLRLAGRLPVRFIGRSLERAIELIGGLRALRDLRTQVWLWVASVAIWVLAGLVNHWGFQAVGLRLPFAAGLLLAVTEISGSNVAYAPGAVGVYHSICVLTLSLFGVGFDLALSAAILLHLVVYVPIVLGGLAAIWYEGARFQSPAGLRALVRRWVAGGQDLASEK